MPTERNSSRGEAMESAVRRGKLLALYVASAVAFLAFAGSLSTSAGFCFSNGRLLNDEEFFGGAVDVVIRDPIDGVIEVVPGGRVAKLVHSQRYTGPDQFLQDNPHCCRFVRANSGDGGSEVGLFDKLLGVRVVEVFYSKSYADQSGVQRVSPVSVQVAVTNCGKGRSFR
jgi:hypothetical protein